MILICSSYIFSDCDDSWSRAEARTRVWGPQLWSSQTRGSSVEQIGHQVALLFSSNHRRILSAGMGQMLFKIWPWLVSLSTLAGNQASFGGSYLFEKLCWLLKWWKQQVRFRMNKPLCPAANKAASVFAMNYHRIVTTFSSFLFFK